MTKKRSAVKGGKKIVEAQPEFERGATFVHRCIVIDARGTAWVICPESGSIRAAKVVDKK